MFNPINELSGTIRDFRGKGFSRRLRKSGKIPSVVYSNGKPTLNITIDPKMVTKMLLTPLRRNIVINLTLDISLCKKVMIRDLQTDPVCRNLIHVDFIEIDPKKMVQVSVPLNIHGKSEAVVAGGRLEQIYHKVPIKVFPEQIPTLIDLDISNIGFGSTAAKELKLPPGIELAIDPNEPIITIKMPKLEKEESEKAISVANSTGSVTS